MGGKDRYIYTLIIPFPSGLQDKAATDASSGGIIHTRCHDNLLTIT